MLIGATYRPSDRPVSTERATDKLRGLENAALQNAKLDKTRGPALLAIGREEAGLAVVVELGREKENIKSYSEPAMRARGLAALLQGESPPLPPVPADDSNPDGHAKHGERPQPNADEADAGENAAR